MEKCQKNWETEDTVWYIWKILIEIRGEIMYGETNVKNPQAGYTMGVPEVL